MIEDNLFNIFGIIALFTALFIFAINMNKLINYDEENIKPENSK